MQCKNRAAVVFTAMLETRPNASVRHGPKCDKRSRHITNHLMSARDSSTTTKFDKTHRALSAKAMSLSAEAARLV